MINYLSQSETKALGLFVIDRQLHEGDVCPKLYKWKKEHDHETVSMLHGKYGETGVLGSGRGGEKTTDLPRKKNGDKRISHIRIDNQIHAAKEFMEDKGVYVGHNTQVRLFTKKLADRFGVEIGGELDVFPTPVLGSPYWTGGYDGNKNKVIELVDDNPCCIVDVKFTQDIYNDFFMWKKPELSSYCWGDVSVINYNQPLFYHWLIRNINKEELIEGNPVSKDIYDFIFSPIVQRNIDSALFYFLIVGYGKPAVLRHEQIMLHPVRWTKEYEGLFYYLVEKSIERYNNFEASGFEPIKVDNKMCDKCPVRAANKCELFR